ncbi:MAG: LysM peptidoglycan-binding domain-containing protein [Anaerolineae bacterium]
MLSLKQPFKRPIALVFLTVVSLGLTTSRVLADPVVHTVQNGDTLHSLAQRYGTTVETILRANALRNPSLIYRGQPLIIPASNGEATAYQSVSSPAAQAAYTVQPGDTLIGIALRFGTTVRELAEVNHLGRQTLLFAGQRLKLPNAALGVAGGPIPPGLKRIEVDVSEQRMRVYEANQLIWDWPASTGLPGRPTRYGRFQVLDKIPMAYSRPWQLWMPHWLGIYWAGASENGIHSLPIINGQKLWAGYLGSRISYGCVVIGTEEGEKLFNWADVGTAVEIRE